jgi:hypothetical protein
VLAALVLLAGSALLIPARLYVDRSSLERATAAALLFPALAIGLVELLSVFRMVATIPFLVGAVALFLGALALAGDAGREVLEDDFAAGRETLGAMLRSPGRALSVIVGLASVAMAILASYLLVPWAWDALGYHLPFVFDVLSERTIRTVPTHIHYVNSYPHLADVFFVAFRLSLLDGTFIETAQLCFAPLGVLSIALLARRAGVPTARGLALGMLSLALPTAALQLCANYVDFAYATLVLAAFAFASGPLEPRALALYGLAAGLALGTKPSAPPLVLLASVYVLVRAYRASRTGEAILALGASLAIGAWKYVENLAIHHNPIWPVQLRLGPVTLPGLTNMEELATMGLGPPMREHGWLLRIFDSWTTVFPQRYVFDMRAGGFGPLFAFVLLPATAATIVAALRSSAFRAHARRVAVPVALIAVTTLASPGAYWARYTLGLPSALLVLALAASEALPSRWRTAGDTIAALCAAVGLALSYPGYTVDGPGLFTLIGMDAHEREGAYGVDPDEWRFRDARELLHRGEAFAYDEGFGLPGRIYPLDGRGRVVFLDHEPATPDELVRFVDENQVRVIAAAEPRFRQTANLARQRPERFRWLFRCPEADPCSVFEVLAPPARAGAGSAALPPEAARSPAD